MQEERAIRFDILGDALAYAASILVTASLFLLIALSLQVTPDAPPPRQDIVQEQYLPPPPPPTPRPEEEPLNFTPRDFAFDLTPEPFVVSIDFLPIKLGVKQESFSKITFDVNQLIEEHRSSGLESFVIYDTKEVDIAPVMTRRIIPNLPPGDYPDRVRAIVQYRVTEMGLTEDITILDTNAPDLDDAIIRSLQKCRFKPAIKDGKPVNSWVRQPYIINTRAEPESPFSR